MEHFLFSNNLDQKNNFQLSEEIISLEALSMASEIWITSSTREIVPVVTLDSEKVGDGAPGPVFKKMKQLFQDYKASL